MSAPFRSITSYLARLAVELKGLGAEHEQTGGIETVLYHPGFPVDISHNAMIGREKLAIWAALRTAYAGRS